MQRELRMIDPDVVFLEGLTLRDNTAAQLLPARLLAAMLGAAGLVAVWLAAISIRFGTAGEAYTASALYGLPMIALFVVHLAVAIPTFVIWCSLAVLSWRRFSRTLPGPFGRTHRRWGKLAFVGLCLSSATGTGLYVMGFAF